MSAFLPNAIRHALFVAWLVVNFATVPDLALAQSDPLPSWNEGAIKKSITDFVSRVTMQGAADFVPTEQRIATFDNDGTLWCEQPVYFQLAFAFDRIKAMAPQHPDWKTTQPFKAILDKDMKALAATGEKGCCRSWRGSTGDAAIFTEHVKLAHIIRKVLLRQIAITNYVNPF